MLKQFVDFCIDRRTLVLWMVAVLSLPLLFFASKVQIATNFADLLPAGHPYMAVHNRFKSTFGGSNAVTIVMEVEQGDIFRTDFLERLRAATLELRTVDGVNAEQVVSLASRKLRDVRASSDGWETTPLMFPGVPSDRAGIDALRRRVLRNSAVYGKYVSPDLKAALISVDFYDHLLKPATAFQQIRTVMARGEAPGIRIRMTGEPIVAGWVAHYLGETMLILAASLAVLDALLFLITRTWRAMLVSGLAGLLSGAWALGIAVLLGIAFDPLVVVVAFLVTARAISHSVQLVIRFDDEVRAGARTSVEAAKSAMLGLFKPGMLGVVTDAGCMLVVLLMPIPLLKKTAIIGSAWMLTIALSAVVMTPVLLSRVQLPLRHVHPIDSMPLIDRFLGALARGVCGKARHALAAGAALLIVASGWYAAVHLAVGDTHPGSPIFRPDSRLNVDAAEINRCFPGAYRMFVALNGDGEDDIKRTEALHAMSRFQRYMEAQPEIGSTLSLADLVRDVKRLLRDGNHRYEELGRTQRENGELLYLLASGADASDMDRFADPRFKSASITLLLRDQRGETVRTAVTRMKEFIAAKPVDGLTFLLAGGAVGITAALNEIILARQIESITLALLVVMLCCAVAYRSLEAGLFFMAPVLLANTVTFGFMAWHGMGLTIHILPVAALGIGLGVDYAFYVVDAIREGVRRGMAVEQATHHALTGAGKGVVITAGVLIASVAIWASSSLRFQSEMALLMAVWLFVAAAGALLLMPSLVATFKPQFVFDHRGS